MVLCRRALAVPDLGKPRHCPAKILVNCGYCLRKLVAAPPCVTCQPANQPASQPPASQNTTTTKMVTVPDMYATNLDHIPWSFSKFWEHKESKPHAKCWQNWEFIVLCVNAAGHCCHCLPTLRIEMLLWAEFFFNFSCRNTLRLEHCIPLPRDQYILQVIINNICN